MKKKMTPILLLMLCTILLSACTPNMTSYMEKSEELSKWPGAVTSGSMNVSVTVEEEEMSFPITFEGKSIGADKAEVLMKFGAFKTDEETIQIPDMKMFVNGGKIYFPTSYFSFLAGLTGGEENNELLKNDSIEYITFKEGNGMLDPSSKYLQYITGTDYQEDIKKFTKIALGNYKPIVDMKVDGNTFTYDATSDNLIDEGFGVVDHMVANWANVSKSLLPILTKSGIDLTQEDLDSFVKEYNKEEVTTSIKEAKDLLKGTEIHMKDTFEDEKTNSEMKMTLSMKDIMKMTMDIKVENKKDEKVEINFPAANQVKEITMDEYMELLGVSGETPILVTYKDEPIEFDVEPYIENDRTLVPVRAIMETLGAKVEWDQDTKTVTAKDGDKTIQLVLDSKTAKVNDKEVTLDAPATMKEDRVFIPLRFISESLGHEVSYENNGFIAVITIK